MEEHNILIPLLLTLGAGLATGIGSAIAFFAKRTNKRLLSFSLGLSGGVMIYVSFVELFQQANTTLSAEWGAHTGVIVTVASFFAGILLIGVIDRLVPSIENPHEAHRVEEMDHQPHTPRLMLMVVLTALGNVIGSNIANILLILGLSATIHPLSMDGITVWDLLMVVLSSVLLFLAAFTFKRRAIDRWEGAIFLAIYVAYIGYLIR